MSQLHCWILAPDTAFAPMTSRQREVATDVKLIEPLALVPSAKRCVEEAAQVRRCARSPLAVCAEVSSTQKLVPATRSSVPRLSTASTKASELASHALCMSSLPSEGAPVTAVMQREDTWAL